jgi:hypothetical protein
MPRPPLWDDRPFTVTFLKIVYGLVKWYGLFKKEIGNEQCIEKFNFAFWL